MTAICFIDNEVKVENCFSIFMRKPSNFAKVHKYLFGRWACWERKYVSHFHQQVTVTFWEDNVSPKGFVRSNEWRSEWGDRYTERKTWNLAKFQVVQRMEKVGRNRRKGKVTGLEEKRLFFFLSLSETDKRFSLAAWRSTRTIIME